MDIPKPQCYHINRTSFVFHDKIQGKYKEAVEVEMQKENKGEEADWYNSPNILPFLAWFISDWEGKFKTLKYLLKTQRRERMRSAWFQYRIYYEKIWNHTSIAELQEVHDCIPLQTGIQFNIKGGLVGKVQLADEFLRCGIMLLNSKIDSTMKGFDFELLLYIKLANIDRLKLKGDIIASVNFTCPVKVTEYIEFVDIDYIHKVEIEPYNG